MAIGTFSTLALIVTAAATFVCYLCWIVIYRLYVSPISEFPGPRLAALTFWFVSSMLPAHNTCLSTTFDQIDTQGR